MNQRERIAKAMYEAPDIGDDTVHAWPPSYPTDREWWLSRADAALAAFAEALNQGYIPPGWRKIESPIHDAHGQCWCFGVHCDGGGVCMGDCSSPDDEREALALAKIMHRADCGCDEDPGEHDEPYWTQAKALISAGVGFRRTVQGEPTAEEWSERAHAARDRAIWKGYTPEHDAEHGIRHLLNWAIDYARRGRAEESSGLMLSALALLDVQGEPSDAALDAACHAFGHHPWGTDPRGAMRAALRAAAETGGEHRG